jgi:hypothetical protein
MKRSRFVPLALVTLLGIGVMLPAAGWLSPRAAPSDAVLRRADADDLCSEAAARHRRGQPRHWRTLFLHH